MNLRSLVLASALVALGTGAASATSAPQPSDANPPGALKYSKPDGFTNSGVSNAPSGWRDAPVGLRNQQPARRNHCY